MYPIPAYLISPYSNPTLHSHRYIHALLDCYCSPLDKNNPSTKAPSSISLAPSTRCDNIRHPHHNNKIHKPLTIFLNYHFVLSLPTIYNDASHSILLIHSHSQSPSISIQYLVLWVVIKPHLK